jgi:hypothetical protein
MIGRRDWVAVVVQAVVSKVRELVEKEHEVFQARKKQTEALLQVSRWKGLGGA